MKKAFFVTVHASKRMNNHICAEGGIHSVFFAGDYRTGLQNIVAINPGSITFAFGDSDSDVERVEAVVARAVKCDMFVEKTERLAKLTDSAQ